MEGDHLYANTSALVRSVLAEAKRSADVERDDLDDYLEEQLDDAAFRQAFDDAAARAATLQKLTACRKAMGLSQAIVAEAMATTQSAVSELEAGDTDPRLSTLQRYARAVGRKLALTLENDWAVNWLYVKAEIHPTEGAAFEFDWQPKRLEDLLAQWSIGTRPASRSTSAPVVIGDPIVNEPALAS